ncbi:hypothetical protein GLOTRDRAFT_125283 [Gloeophyllum trabeum ATCC 11539]|uniref:Zinc finger PHD-type domain-containing protein n=1 Tax=Gloeophyllum trabeum (strain ATCC 11539 / FP-39264 / Madison 617) TaxID=670483 RepID=S7RVW9_GLOTA|nr:uncharacterized protein GLOTRDRAFT_125283 [Gloeophyllum trabeum ATCC 11539]EPQ58965.1 hypothetical protein GLOTRDRAFT_125283 [Gloeophyllum trabeum ATCC 11539]
MPNYRRVVLLEIELQHEIQKETTKYIKHCVRATPPSSSAPSPSPQTPNPSIPNSANLTPKVSASYALLDQLNSEKIALSQRMTDLIARAKARLDYDLARVLVAQGDADPASASVTAAAAGTTSGYSWANLGPSSIGAGTGSTRSAIKEVNERLATTIALPEVPNLTATAMPLPKRRKLNVQPSTPTIKLPSPSPSIIASTPQPSAAPGRSRLHNQIGVTVRGRRAAQAAVKSEQKEEEEEDAEGDEDMDAEAEGEAEGAEVEEAGEDDRVYCFCGKPSYGEFHLSCVNLKPPLPETWYCDECVRAGRAPPGYRGPDAQQPTRKRGRK